MSDPVHAGSPVPILSRTSSADATRRRTKNRLNVASNARICEDTRLLTMRSLPREVNSQHQP
ncbi:hypothetical protein KCP75_06965 [Salmonella enterica subsp. enterica]|nr:hypothetical protein KCP75_06965 [Salmonella enterica subsp. enterica]